MDVTRRRTEHERWHDLHVLLIAAGTVIIIWLAWVATQPPAPSAPPPTQVPESRDRVAQTPSRDGGRTTPSKSTGAPARDTNGRSELSGEVKPRPVVGPEWEALAECESGGNWQINTGNGYYGGLQFSLTSWRGVGGSGYPHEASVAEQIKRAEMLQAVQGWGAWPACSRIVGLG